MSTAELRANAEVVSDRPRRGWHPGPIGKRVLIALAIVVALLGIAAGVLAYMTHDYTERYAGKILPGSTVAGVEVGGMTPAEALRAVRAEIRPELMRRFTITWQDETWRTTVKRLGSRSNARAAVASAYAASRRTSFLDRAQMKVFGDEMDFERGVAITSPRAGVNRLVDRVAAQVDTEPVDASLDYSTGWVEIAPSRVGYEVQRDDARAQLMNGFRQEDGDVDVALPVKTLQPAVTTAAYDQVLLVRIGENQLYLYENGEISHSWPIATGLPEFPTPTGLYEVTLKRYMPTWVNPDPSGWGASMPASIAPGPDNPLGLRALNWDASGIRFHGTTATYSLGYNASHGCVRLSNDDVIELYNIVDVGTPIVSTQVADFKPLRSAPATDDPVPVADDGGGEGSGGSGDSGGSTG